MYFGWEFDTVLRLLDDAEKYYPVKSIKLPTTSNDTFIKKILLAKVRGETFV